ncbi:chaperone modulator CbpM [Chitinophaga sp. 212800010-3]|uniref:chaperone modulator CbpM n=1 Tax=unclassified Chitinophaga TaxID=2619133 RepID=UPI002DF60315|nr:MerR family transcriptional regulator [Chitinophaga sp. 212800010-3]
MENINRISVTQCCTYYQINASFVQELDEHGLIALIRSEEDTYIAYEELTNLEKYMHMHYDLDINMAGMEAIKHLLQRMHTLQKEVKTLRNELGHLR